MFLFVARFKICGTSQSFCFRTLIQRIIYFRNAFFHTAFNALLFPISYNHCNLIACNEIIIHHICLPPSWKPDCLFLCYLKSFIFHECESVHLPVKSVFINY